MIHRSQAREIPGRSEMFVVWNKELAGTCLMEHSCNYCKKNLTIYQPRKSFRHFVCKNGTTIMFLIQMAL
jgi:hypothetical protein